MIIPTPSNRHQFVRLTWNAYMLGIFLYVLYYAFFRTNKSYELPSAFFINLAIFIAMWSCIFGICGLLIKFTLPKFNGPYSLFSFNVREPFREIKLWSLVLTISFWTCLGSYAFHVSFLIEWALITYLLLSIRSIVSALGDSTSVQSAA